MEKIWKTACTHYNIPEEVASTWFDRIHRRLSEPAPTRVYHNWDEMLAYKRPHLQDCEPSVVLAAFFQYYNFDGNRSCVQANCEAFREFCCDASLDNEETKTLILRLLGDKNVESTELFTQYEQAANLLQDLDLIILAGSAADYEKYTTLLRREYSHLDNEHYKTMRLKVLETLLMIPNIFSSTVFQSKYEEAARTNIKQEIDQLKAL